MTAGAVKILLIEDNPGDARLIEETLTDTAPAFELKRAESLSAGLKRLSSEGFDVLLLDLGLPDSQGLDTFTRMSKEFPEIPVVVLTGLDDSDVAVTAVRTGAQDYIVKGQVEANLFARSLRYAVERKRIQDALLKSEDEKKLILESLTESVLFVDRNLRIVWANRAAVASARLPLADAVGKACYELWPKRSKPCVGCPVKSAFKTGLEQRGEIVLKNDRLWTARGYPVRDARGKIVGAVEVALDITEHKRAERALRESEMKYRAVTATAQDAVIMVDSNGLIAYWNPAAERIFGYTSDEALNQKLHKLLAPGRYHKAYEEGFARFKRTGKGPAIGKTLELEAVRKNGTEFPVELSLSASGLGSKILATGMIRDITERKLAERELTENERKYRTLVENIPQKIFLKDAKSVYVSCNENYARDLGITTENVTGKTDYDFYSEELADRYRADDRRVMESGVMEEIEEKRVHNGQEFFVHTVKTPVKDDNGRTVGVLGVHEDITEHKQLQEQLLQAQKMEAIGRLAGGVAHDFNNLLTVMLGYSEMLLYNLEDERLKSHVEAISDAAQRAERLTSQLLAFSRKQVREPRVLNINDIVAETDKMLRRVIGEDIELAMVIDKDLSNVRIDPGQIEQVIMNLAINARDAMPEGGKLTIETADIELDAEYTETHMSVQPGYYVMLAVTDTGFGMDKETQNRLFEPFFTTKEVGAGTGLGLSTVYGVVKQNRGNIWVYSEPGKGTTFKVYLPVVREEASAARAEKVLPEVQGGSETILVVEDEEVIKELAQQVLEQKGYKVMTARHGAEALIMAEQYDTIHLLLTDVIMPEMSGKELAERLLALRSDLRVIYMSGYADAAIFQNGRVPDAASYLQKPFTPDGLLRKVREVLDEPE